MRPTSQEPGTCLRQPVVYISGPVWRKMMARVLTCPIEINGFGYVAVQPDGTIHVTDVFTIPQIASAGDVEVDMLAYARHVTDMMQNGDDPARLRFQWHSHVDMPAYFSGTDQLAIDTWPGDWLISLVVNKRGQYSCQLDTYYDGFRTAIEIKPVIGMEISTAQMEEALDEVNRNVRRRGLIRRPVVGKNYIPAAAGYDMPAGALPVTAWTGTPTLRSEDGQHE